MKTTDLERLGLPEKYRQLRDCQRDALLRNQTTRSRYVGHSMPTGSGKSLVYIIDSLACGGRAAILTSTKALQDQIVREFSQVGVVDLRGRRNYECSLRPGGPGPCSSEAAVRCRHRDSPACPYRTAFERARSARIVVTNYACWISLNANNRHLGYFDLVSLDEAHDAFSEMVSSTTVTIAEENVRDLPKCPMSENAAEWRSWYATLTETYGYGGGRRLLAARGLAKLAMVGTDWIVRRCEGGFEFEPLWVHRLCPSLLYRTARRVAFYSAVLVPKTLGTLGADPHEFHSYPYPFEPGRSPIYQIPCARINRSSTGDDLDRLVAMIDRIVSERMDRKGIVHTVSYEMCRETVARSRWSSVIVTHSGSGDIRRAVSEFRRMDPPALLVSPSVSTGLDFPGDECRYQIIAKTPWPDLTDRSVASRTQADPEYAALLTAQSLCQMTGRGMRSADDWCENFLLDDATEDFVRMHGSLLPHWWTALYRKRTDPPPPPNIGV